MWIQMYNECNFLTVWHEITLDGLTYRNNQSLLLKRQGFQYSFSNDIFREKRKRIEMCINNRPGYFDITEVGLICNLTKKPNQS